RKSSTTNGRPSSKMLLLTPNQISLALKRIDCIKEQMVGAKLQFGRWLVYRFNRTGCSFEISITAQRTLPTLRVQSLPLLQSMGAEAGFAAQALGKRRAETTRQYTPIDG